MWPTNGDLCLDSETDESSNIKQFRTITLLGVEGKVFFSIVA